MNIGIVIDGVITNLEQFQFDYGSKFYFEQKMSLKNPRASSIADIFHRHGNCLRKEAGKNAFWDTYFEYYLQKISPRPFASEIIFKLHDQGNRIYLFCTRTHRCHHLSKEEIIKSTKLWLMEHEIYFDFLIFSDMINLDLMKKYKIQLLFDAQPSSVQEISLAIPVACFHAKFNELCHGENVYRVFSWYDFYDKLEVISKEKMMM